MAKALNFDTGIEEFSLNGAITVRFNPTDSAFVEKMYSTFTALETKQDDYQKRVDEIGGDSEQLFAYSRERDAEMRAIIDDLLGEGVSDAVFVNGDDPINCYALAKGLPMWINLMLAIAETVQESFAAQQKQGDPRLKKLSKKYEAMANKYKK